MDNKNKIDKHKMKNYRIVIISIILNIIASMLFNPYLGYFIACFIIGLLWNGNWKDDSKIIIAISLLISILNFILFLIVTNNLNLIKTANYTFGVLLIYITLFIITWVFLYICITIGNTFKSNTTEKKDKENKNTDNIKKETSETPIITKENDYYCKYCGNKFDEESVYCGKCGKKRE